MLERKLVAILEYDNVKRAVKIQEEKLEHLETEYWNCVKTRDGFDYGTEERKLWAKKVNSLNLTMCSVETKLNRLRRELAVLGEECDISECEPGSEYLNFKDPIDEILNVGVLHGYKF